MYLCIYASTELLWVEKELWELFKQHEQIRSRVIKRSSVRQHISSLPAEGKQERDRQFSTFKGL